MNDWTPDSWQRKPSRQQPKYPDPAELDEVVRQLSAFPPLTTSWEVESLKRSLAGCADGEVFLLQGGDCAESFSSCEADTITAQLKILLQMSLVLTHGTKKRVVRVGRIAGQYAKPRSEYWNLDFVQHSHSQKEYEQIVRSIHDSLDFMENVLETPVGNVRRAEIYTSHEGLLLYYEQAQTRRVPRREGFYNLATHFPWIGLRTSDPSGAHVEYFRGIRNPIAVKVGAATSDEQLEELLEVLHPDDEPGRLTLVHRMGAGKIDEHLPRIIETVRRSGKRVVFSCDPMHGNTEIAADGHKTRRFDRILHELERAFAIHREMGSVLGGVHLELTGEDVTECVGGARGLKEEDLGRAYQTSLDPRLNYEQALELAMIVSHRLRTVD